MESRLIYKISERLIHKVIWDKITDDGEWMHFMKNDEANKQLINDLINKVFAEDNIYSLKGRENSCIISKVLFMKSLKKPSLDNAILWDTCFQHVLQINSIGVVRTGKYTGKMPTLV